MNMKKRIFAVLVAVFLIFPLAVTSYSDAPSVQSNQPIHLRMTTLSMGSSWYIIGATVANMLSEGLPKGSKIDVLPYMRAA